MTYLISQILDDLWYLTCIKPTLVWNWNNPSEAMTFLNDVDYVIAVEDHGLVLSLEITDVALTEGLGLAIGDRAFIRACTLPEAQSRGLKDIWNHIETQYGEKTYRRATAHLRTLRASVG